MGTKYYFKLQFIIHTNGLIVWHQFVNLSTSPIQWVIVIHIGQPHTTLHNDRNKKNTRDCKPDPDVKAGFIK